MENIENQISEGIKNAMKAKDKVRLETLRNVKKYIIEAKTSGTNVNQLSDDECIKIIQKLAKQGTDSADIYTKQSRADLAEYEMAQVNVLKEFLPKQLSDQELTAAVNAIIEKVGASSMKEMGKVMGVASKELAGKADGKDISNKVKALLS
ncbi:MAG: GatB/YqeY domain-containing protein [Rikenellaceae bacterium]